nr:methyltransferase domain-containing protein [Candidatus Methanomethylophilus sp. 1R26]
MENSSRPSGETVKKGVREYYGKELKRSSDLKTGACKCSGNMSDEVKEALALVDDEIIERSYGCGSPIPPLLEGKTVLDLGCGTGKDVYIASKLVGGSGSVIGVDMTPEQLEVAKRHEARWRGSATGSPTSDSCRATSRTSNPSASATARWMSSSRTA